MAQFVAADEPVDADAGHIEASRSLHLPLLERRKDALLITFLMDATCVLCDLRAIQEDILLMWLPLFSA